MLIGGISPTQNWWLESCKFLQKFTTFKLEFFLLHITPLKVTNNQWNLFYNGKGGKYQILQRQHFPSELSLYNPSGLTVCLVQNLTQI